MKIIMKINLKWRIKLFNDKNASILLEEIIKEFSRYVNTKKSTPVFLWLPQKDDLMFIKENSHFYEDFNKKIQKLDDLIFIDTTKDLLQEEKISEFYSDDNEYGGHYSKEGNKKIAEIIFSELNKHELV